MKAFIRLHPLAKGLLISILLLAFSANAIAKTLNLDVMIEGMKRKVLVVAPDKPGIGPVPLVIVYHGRGDSHSKFARAVALHKVWREAIVVYPNGEIIDTKPPMRGWQYHAGEYADRDLKLTDWILEEMGRRYSISPQSTFAAGFSNGGHFVFLLKAERNDAFAAFVAIGALQPKFHADTAPKPFLYLFGALEGAQYRDDWQATVKALARHNRSSNEQQDYLSCCKVMLPKDDGAPMIYGSYNAGHIWPYDGNQWLRHFFTQIVLERDHQKRSHRE